MLLPDCYVSGIELHSICEIMAIVPLNEMRKLSVLGLGVPSG